MYRAYRVLINAIFWGGHPPPLCTLGLTPSDERKADIFFYLLAAVITNRNARLI